MTKKASSMSGGGSKNKKKGKKKNRSAPDAVAMKVKAPGANPFESIWSRRKFDFLGKKQKGEERRMGLARSRAIDKRKKTLLKEYEQSGKSSVFVDKRIGEQNDELEEFDKAIMRSQRERQLKLNKKSKYNLSDGEDDDFEFGDLQSLGNFSERDDYEDELLPNDEDEAEIDKNSAIFKQLDAHNTQNPRERSLMEGEENKHKSKKEVMEEVILKSKYFKAQKAKEREENEQLMDDLDKKFTSLVQSEALLLLTEPGKLNALKALVNRSIPAEHIKKNELSATQKIESSTQQEKPDSYDKLVKEMGLDMRARPSDRTKTPDEIAEEKRERLEALEEERQKRMLATDDSSDEDNDNVEKPSTQKLRSISGDDLGDSFFPVEEPGTRKGWIDEILEREDDDNSESEDDGSSEDSESAEGDGDEQESDGDDEECEKTHSLKDWEQSDDDKFSTDLEDDDEGKHDDEEAVVPRSHKKAEDNAATEIRKKDNLSLDAMKIQGNDKKPSSQEKNLPYLIEAPKSCDELCALFEKCDNEDIILLIERIRISNAIKHAAENRKKMQVFYGVLLQYFAVLANKKPLNFELLNLLVKPLMEISVELPYFAAICARQRILRTRTQFCEAVKSSEISCWPSLKTLFLFRLWSLIFPCSDFRHPVMTPAVLLMCEYLTRCSIFTGQDIATGTFLCSMVLSVIKESKKFCPEAIMFLRTLLLAATDRKQVLYQDSQFYHFMDLKALRPLLCISGCVKEITSPLNFFMLMDLPEDSAFFSSDNFRASVLVTVIETLEGFVHIYEELSSFPEIFLPISVLLLEVAQQKNMPDSLQDKLKDVSKLIQKKTDEHHILRSPLQMRKQKPVPIRLVNPNFEENFVKGRDYDPDRERAEERKLKKQLKREAKGAYRELRKDNYFLFEVKQKEKALLQEEKAERSGKVLAFLQEQEHAFKSGQLGKGGGRKRRR